LQVFILLRSLLLGVKTVLSKLAIRQKLVSTELFVIVGPFLTTECQVLCMENRSAQKSVLLQVFLLLRSLLLRAFLYILSNYGLASSYHRSMGRILDLKQKYGKRNQYMLLRKGRGDQGGDADYNDKVFSSFHILLCLIFIFNFFSLFVSKSLY